jgi:hypothetical protein
MSQYQYYEFLALDRRLTDKELKEIRAVSTEWIARLADEEKVRLLREAVQGTDPQFGAKLLARS